MAISQIGSNATGFASGLDISDGDVTLASGHGISFAATSDGAGTDSSELLDDYEEGTWTPVIVTGGTSISYESNGNQGHYAKIGGVVHAYFYFYANITGNAAHVAISGLPYTSANTATYNRGIGGVCNYQSFSTEYVQVYLSATTDDIALYKNGSTTWTLTNSTAYSQKFLIGGVTYMV